MMDGISNEELADRAHRREGHAKVFNSVYIMADSGARGCKQQMRQLAGMRGLMAKPSGEIIEQPITTNFREGLTVQEYFISTHGARKGLADTALKTANSGYLTRRLVDVAQEAVITEFDCGTIQGVECSALMEDTARSSRRSAIGSSAAPRSSRFRPGTDEVIVEEGRAHRREGARWTSTRPASRPSSLRSVLTCDAMRGICAKCYGRDLARGQLVDVGEAVGIIAAQSIGEPGTQLTMRTFHLGGASHHPGRQERARGPLWRRGQDARRRADRAYRKDSKTGIEAKYWVVMNRHSQLQLLDERGRVRERYDLLRLAAARRRGCSGSTRRPSWPAGTPTSSRSSPRPRAWSSTATSSRT